MKNSETHSQEVASIPSWMLNKNKLIENEKSKTHFLRKTLSSISGVFENEIFSEKYAVSERFLQFIDSRVKLVTFLFFMIFSGLTKNMIILIFLAFIAIMNAFLSGLNLKNYFKRVWMILPLIILIFSLPAATSLLTNGTPLFYIYRSLNFSLLGLQLPSEIYFTLEGFGIIIKMALRIGVSISFGYLLIMTTRWNYLTKSFSILRVPAVIISILNMTYRYIFVLSQITTELIEARFLRTVGILKNTSNREFVAHNISYLFIKSSFMSEEIYNAMRCRAFTGEPVCLNTFKLGRVDFLWIMNNIVIILILLTGEILF